MNDVRPWAITTLAGAALAVVAAFMPWVTATAGIFTVSRDGIDGDGQLTLIAALFVAGFALLELLGAARAHAWLAALSITGGVGILGVAAYHIIDIADAGLKVGGGLYLTAIAAVVVLAGGTGTIVKAKP